VVRVPLRHTAGDSGAASAAVGAEGTIERGGGNEQNFRFIGVDCGTDSKDVDDAAGYTAFGECSVSGSGADRVGGNAVMVKGSSGAVASGDAAMDLGSVRDGGAESVIDGAARGDGGTWGAAVGADDVIGPGGTDSDNSTATAADGAEGVLGLGSTVSDEDATAGAGGGAAVVGAAADARCGCLC
jgi:hypothetical protein